MPSVQSADGVPIHYEVTGAGEPAVVLVHGWGMDSDIWDRTVPHLAARRRVVTVDLAGHGQSGKGRAEVTIDAFAADVTAVVDAVAAERAILVGHSMAGPVCLRAASLVPDGIAGVVLVDTVLDPDQRPPAERLEAFFASLEADFRGTIARFFGDLMFTEATDPAVRERIIARAQAVEPRFGAAALRAAIGSDPRPALAALRVPVRAVNADKFPTQVDALRRYAPSYEVELVRGVGHYPMIEKPDELNVLLERAVSALS